VIALRVVIEGRVQGVGFRAWTAREARRRGLTGYVRNRADGAVEAVFRGGDATVLEMVEVCRKGPRLSIVSSLTTAPHPMEPWSDFAILPEV
jgi:acylphosphatase